MATKVESILVYLTCWVTRSTPRIQIEYVPLTANLDRGLVPLADYRGTLEVRAEDMPAELTAKLTRLSAALMQLIPAAPPIEIDGKALSAPPPTASHFYVEPDGTARVHYRQPLGKSGHRTLRFADLTEGTQRLLANIQPTLDQLAWNDLRTRLGALPVTQSSKKKVLISYRKSGPERVAFAEAIAHRLGREGFEPWFDEWEVKAGDSLPREIGDGFDGVYAVVPVLTADYPGGTWAREELETTITKRVQERIKVIPVLYEKCEIPQLLRPLVYVDCTEHDPDVFEKQFAKIIDALNELELNPYR